MSLPFKSLGMGEFGTPVDTFGGLVVTGVSVNSTGKAEDVFNESGVIVGHILSADNAMLTMTGYCVNDNNIPHFGDVVLLTTLGLTFYGLDKTALTKAYVSSVSDNYTNAGYRTFNISLRFCPKVDYDTSFSPAPPDPSEPVLKNDYCTFDTGSVRMDMSYYSNIVWIGRESDSYLDNIALYLGDNPRTVYLGGTGEAGDSTVALGVFFKGTGLGFTGFDYQWSTPTPRGIYMTITLPEYGTMPSFETFANFIALERLLIWNGSLGTTAEGTFSGCTRLTDVELIGTPFSNLVNAQRLFDFCPLSSTSVDAIIEALPELPPANRSIGMAGVAVTDQQLAAAAAKGWTITV